MRSLIIRDYPDTSDEKYSIDSYLEILNQFTDKKIRDLCSKGYKYIGGECSIKKNFRKVRITLSMYFANGENDRVRVSGTRKVSKNVFNDEALSALDNEKKYEIISPEEL